MKNLFKKKQQEKQEYYIMELEYEDDHVFSVMRLTETQLAPILWLARHFARADGSKIPIISIYKKPYKTNWEKELDITKTDEELNEIISAHWFQWHQNLEIVFDAYEYRLTFKK